jgi:signal transduction histidine kinase
MFNFLKACAFLIAALPITVSTEATVSADDAAPLVSLRDLSSLDLNEASKERPLRVTGVVTYALTNWGTLIVQDGEHSAFVEVDGQTILPDSASAGDLIEIVGSTRSGRVKAKIHADEIVHRGKGELPTPVPLKTLDDLTAEDWNRFVVFDGTVYEYSTDSGHVYLHVATADQPVYVVVRYEGEPAQEEDWLGLAVQVRGALVTSSTKSGPLTIKTYPSYVERPGSPEERGNRPPIQQLGSLRFEALEDGKERKPVRVIAQAISGSRSSDLVLRDATGAILVHAEKLPELRVGDIVVATGVVTERRKNDVLALSGAVRRVGVGRGVKPVEISVEKAVEHPFEYVSVTAAFRGFAKRDGKKIPVLRDVGGIFTVSGTSEGMSVFDDLADRSSLHLTGVCWPKAGDAYDFELLADHIDVLYEPPKPPGETLDRSLAAAALPVPQPSSPIPPSGPGSIGPRIATAVALLLLLVLLAAFLILLRRTREQRKFYATIHEQLNEVSHVSRLNTLAEMVGALAHELNQPLASVTNYAETARLLNERPGDNTPQFDTLLKRIASESLRAGEIIRRLRSLVQRKTPGQVSTSMNQVVNDALDMFRMQELVANGTLDVQLDDDLPSVQIDPIQFQQVVLNFLLNARDATTGLEGRLAKITVSTERDNDRLIVSVEDNGRGIASSDPQSVFEPYFTTKEDGMGLGLAICRTIVESHSGTIHAENLKPCGARLTISLPIENVVKLEAA